MYGGYGTAEGARKNKWLRFLKETKITPRYPGAKDLYIQWLENGEQMVPIEQEFVPDEDQYRFAKYYVDRYEQLYDQPSEIPQEILEEALESQGLGLMVGGRRCRRKKRPLTEWQKAVQYYGSIEKAKKHYDKKTQTFDK